MGPDIAGLPTDVGVVCDEADGDSRAAVMWCAMLRADMLCAMLRAEMLSIMPRAGRRADGPVCGEPCSDRDVLWCIMLRAEREGAGW